ncbi:unnamed protein product [Clonostachys rosea]|uniref:RlpA-like protein double-psi beta-barrel domain-containing protein n=1 Tax=Bionectria ochroleuca TaxID=29856 RepID=A0ABY6U0L0_BIOOC|nr:unnamed protein product [Clonostachys rosea]
MSALLKTLFAVAVSATSVAAYAGDMTYFHQGMGACGQFHSDSDAVVALSSFDFGNDANPNKAAVCGKWIKITHKNGKTARAQVWDKCPGGECVSGSIDVSPSVFTQIVDSSVGRTQVTWEFEDGTGGGQNTATTTVPDTTVNNEVASAATVTVTVTVTAQPQVWQA